MRNLATALYVCLLLAAPAQAIEIKGETKIAQHKLVRLTVEGAGDDAAILWDLDEEKLDAYESGRMLVFTGPPGTYRLKCRAITRDKDGRTKVETARATVTIEGKAPEPGPGPGPGPKPPGPKPPDPTPEDAPIKAPGFRVLILYETAEVTKLPAKQASVLFAKSVRDYLKAKCAKDRENPESAYRIWDKDVDASAESKPWQDALKRPRKSVPWIIVSDGKNGYEGPLPISVEATLTLLKQYGGE